jgi:hypothetical protein
VEDLLIGLNCDRDSLLGNCSFQLNVVIRSHIRVGLDLDDSILLLVMTLLLDSKVRILVFQCQGVSLSILEGYVHHTTIATRILFRAVHKLLL